MRAISAQAKLPPTVHHDEYFPDIQCSSSMRERAQQRDSKSLFVVWFATGYN